MKRLVIILFALIAGWSTLSAQQINPRALWPGGSRYGTDNPERQYDEPSRYNEDAGGTSLLDEMLSRLSGNRASHDGLTISLLLPLSGNNGVRTHFMEFYRGVLIGLDDLKSKGYTATVHLYDTEGSADVVEDIVRRGELETSDLIIGPVYEQEMKIVSDFARRYRIPVVSPLSTLTDDYSANVYQMAPRAEYKNEKLKELLTEEKNIIFVSDDKNDTEFENEMRMIARGVRYSQVKYDSGTFSATIDQMLSSTDENLFVITASNEVSIDRIMATLSSIQNNRLAKSISTGAVKVIGNSKWTRSKTIAKELFFKLEVAFVTNYYADQSNETVAAFNKRYINAFHSIPSLYSYRGYDTTVLFTDAITRMTSDLTFNLNTAHHKALQVPYFFEQHGVNKVNTEWVLVNYHGDYSITVR